jgi:hypothetical protein
MHWSHACSTSTVSALSREGVIRKRPRASESPFTTAGTMEAAALHWLRTGQRTTTEEVLAAEVQRVEEMLRLEAAGLTDCGVCSNCIAGSNCVRVSNRRAAWEGRQGPSLAEEAERLIGRQFEVRPNACASMIAYARA